MKLKHSFVRKRNTRGLRVTAVVMLTTALTPLFFVVHHTVIFKKTAVFMRHHRHLHHCRLDELSGVGGGGAGFTVPLMTERISKDTVTPLLHLFPSPAVIFQPVLLLRHTS